MARLRPLALLPLLAGALLLLSVPRSAAGDEAKDGKNDESAPNVVFTARVEPDSLGADGKGTVVLTGKIKPKVHVYVDPKMFKVKPVEAAGVEYGTFEASKPIDYVSPYDEPGAAPEKVWMGQVVVKIPFTVGPDAKPPVKVGAKVFWSACDDETCFGAENQEVVVDVAVVDVEAIPPGNGSHPANPNPPAPVPPAGGMVETTAPPPAPPASPDGPFTWDGKAASGKVLLVKDEVVVTITPNVKEEFHLYAPGLGATDGDPIRVEGTGPDSVKWEPARFPLFSDSAVSEPVVVRVPFSRNWGEDALELLVRWQGCDSQTCISPEPWTLLREKTGWSVRPGMPKKPDGAVPTPPPTVSERGILFPEVTNDESLATGGTGGEEVSEESLIQTWWKKWGLFFLIPIFLAGVGLAFTPCVLPLIPITVSVIGGGIGTVSRPRLAVLLSAYALGLSLAYGLLGFFGVLLGTSMSAAFENKWVLGGIVTLFVVLSLGMFGVYELQPPAWMQRLQGGAKGGNLLGSFVFGAIGALIASPCTGPMIIAMLAFASKEAGSPLLGFTMFFSMGLGMSAVLFAAGLFNLLMRPGPWMVWVRYGFGVVLFGAALYYAASAGLLEGKVLWAVGGVLAVLVAAGVYRHLVRAEAEEAEPARKKAGVVLGLLAAVVVLIAFLTRPGELTWIDLRDRAHLAEEVRKARAEGKVTVVDVWAPWCTYCRKYDGVFESDKALMGGFEKMHRLRINVDSDPREDLRSALNLEGGQPKIVFVDEKGRLRTDQKIKGWMKDPADGVRKRLQRLGVLPPK